MNLALITTSPSTAQVNSIINRQGPKQTITEPNLKRRHALTGLAKPPFNLSNVAKILISSLSQNGGKVEGLEILAKHTQQNRTEKDNQKETDTFVARFKGNPIIISIEKDLISAADGNNKNQVGIPNKVIISSEYGDSISTTSQELGGKKQDSYIGEGKLNVINFNLNKLVPKETK
jgi:hypothetical protein